MICSSCHNTSVWDRQNQTQRGRRFHSGMVFGGSEHASSVNTITGAHCQKKRNGRLWHCPKKLVVTTPARTWHLCWFLPAPRELLTARKLRMWRSSCVLFHRHTDSFTWDLLAMALKQKIILKKQRKKFMNSKRSQTVQVVIQLTVATATAESEKHAQVVKQTSQDAQEVKERNVARSLLPRLKCRCPKFRTSVSFEENARQQIRKRSDILTVWRPVRTLNRVFCSGEIAVIICWGTVHIALCRFHVFCIMYLLYHITVRCYILPVCRFVVAPYRIAIELFYGYSVRCYYKSADRQNVTSTLNSIMIYYCSLMFVLLFWHEN